MSAFFSGSLDPFLPHVILLSAAIAASFAVAIGIVLENPKWSSANALVIGGVAIEAVCTLLLFGFDEGISGAQQSVIIALETKLAPRVLSDEQQAALLAAVKPFSGQQYHLSVAIGSEPAAFACVVHARLKEAGWKPSAPSGLLQTHPCENGIDLGDEIDINVSSGFRAIFRGDATPAVRNAAVALAATLAHDGIEAEPGFNNITVSDPTMIAVVIGAKL